MKLKHDFVRKLLLFIEEQDSPGIELDGLLIFAKNNNSNEEELLYTVERLVEANYVSARLTRFMSGYDLEIKAITWEGHKFIDTIRDDFVWSKTKSVVSKFSSVSLSIIEKIASGVITQLITQSLNSP